MIPFAPPRIDQEIIDAVVATLKSGWITTGPKTKLFEQKLTAYCGNKATLCVNSATSGLEIILRWFGVGEGDEVIIPAYTYSATANVVVHCGAKPVLVDIGDDFNMNALNIKKAITTKTKVIMPVDFGGFPCDYDLINGIVTETSVKKLFQPNSTNQQLLGRILILSDAAHSIGATYKGRKTGALADISVFSFHAVKNLTTAEGGAIALNLPEPFDNIEVYKYLCIYTLHGQNKDALAKMQKGNWKYDIIEAGYKCNMTDLSAAIGLVELARYDSDMILKRKYICESYSEFFSSQKWAIVPQLKTDTAESSYHLYALRIKNCTETQRDAIIQKIFDQNVSVNVHFIPLPLLTFYKNCGFNISDYPKTYEMFSQEISLPVFYDLTNEQLAKVCEAVTLAVEEVLSISEKEI
ncbi:MAG: DegT/DnrJ/EryC1/StrS aminotransferase family protein [Bacteroidetes bacterium]|nr:DegT/DnrJ/EryC1/StrS aminotransferase family protein [Bacteroidota bacterium]